MFAGPSVTLVEIYHAGAVTTHFNGSVRVQSVRSGMAETSTARRAIEDRFINEWGLLANAWGVSPLLGRIHGLLLLVGRPMTAEEVCERLDISRASASVQLNAILGWGLARRMYLAGDRRQHYLAEPEPWTWFRRAVRVRKEREFDPVIAGLNEAAAEAHQAATSTGDTELKGEAERLAYLLKFVRLFFGGIETFLQIEPSALQAFLRLAEESNEDNGTSRTN
jgi:DNA-binding transcriptional regulator GbsR (MarR family)